MIWYIDDEDKLTRRFDWSGQNRNMTVINESGLYSLVLAHFLDTIDRKTGVSSANFRENINRIFADVSDFS